MIDKKYRLKKRKEFGYMYNHGKYNSNKYITMVTTDCKYGNMHIGFSVSKKVGKAYVRNLIKRRLRAVVREIIPNMNSKFNYIFVAKSELAVADFGTLKKSVIEILKVSGKLLNEKTK